GVHVVQPVVSGCVHGKAYAEYVREFIDSADLGIQPATRNIQRLRIVEAAETCGIGVGITRRQAFLVIRFRMVVNRRYAEGETKQQLLLVVAAERNIILVDAPGFVHTLHLVYPTLIGYYG